MSNIFDIVAEYPDSLPAIKKLRDTVISSNTMNSFSKDTKKTFQKRLLHLGASTSQILHMYILIIRSMRHLDPTDMLLTFVAEPIRQYLMKRKDTIRCIVTALTVEGADSDLHGELRKGGSSLEYVPDEDDEGDGPGENWQPAKRSLNKLDLDSTGAAKRPDVVALLVSIYSSMDVFIDEYRSILASRLLHFSDETFSIEQEIATVELLKIRFGEESLHRCEVMIKDTEDSKRLNHKIAVELNASINTQRCPVTTLMVSSQYWPSLVQENELNNEDMYSTLHPHVHILLETYRDKYAELKKPRQLIYYPMLGNVTFTLDFDDGSEKTFSVNPFVASLLFYVQESMPSPLFLVGLSVKLLDMDKKSISKYMDYWVQRRIVTVIQDISHETDGISYVINENQIDNITNEEYENYLNSQVEEKDGDDSTQDSSANNLIEIYVKGMLTNNKSMTLQRIHSMLKMLATGSEGGGSSDKRYTMTTEELEKFLNTLIISEKIELYDGSYSLKKL